MQILGLGKVRIMRFSGRKGDLEVFLSGSNPDARDKEERQWARLVRAMMREKCTEEKGTRRRGSGISNPPSLADTKREMPNERRRGELPNERRGGELPNEKRGEVNCRKYATEMKNEKAQMRGREKRADDSIVLKKKKEEKGNKAGENCRKYATEMKNEKTNEK